MHDAVPGLFIIRDHGVTHVTAQNEIRYSTCFVNSLIAALNFHPKLPNFGVCYADMVLYLLGHRNEQLDITEHTMYKKLSIIAAKLKINILVYNITSTSIAKNNADGIVDGNYLTMQNDLDGKMHEMFSKRVYPHDIYLGYIGDGSSGHFVRLEPVWD